MLVETCVTYARIIVLSLCLWMYVTLIEMIIVAAMNKADLDKKSYIISGLICVFSAVMMYHFMDAVQIGMIIALSLGFFWSVMVLGLAMYSATSLIMKKHGASIGDCLIAFVFSMIISIIVLLLFIEIFFVCC